MFKILFTLIFAVIVRFLRFVVKAAQDGWKRWEKAYNAIQPSRQFTGDDRALPLFRINDGGFGGPLL